MDFVKCYEQVKDKYTITSKSSDMFCIDTDAMISDYDYVFVAIKNVNNNAVICDYANNLQSISLDKEIIENICKKYDVIFDNYELIKIYNNIDDVKKYIDCVAEISNS